MPIVTTSTSDPFVDGRQSERALIVQRGLERHFQEQGWVTLTEVTLDSGGRMGRRADLVALGPKSEIVIVEIKSSVADFRADTKWPDYRAHCDQLYFATLTDVPESTFPEDAGLYLADAYGAGPIREAPAHPLSPAARRKQILTFARHAARRLTRLAGHAGVDAGGLAQVGDEDGEPVLPLARAG